LPLFLKIRTKKRVASAIFLAVLSLLLSAPSSVFAASLTLLETRGKTIFFSGISATGAPMTALFGKERLKLTGKAVACATCHGYDGLGRSESGITGADITWSTLMKPYGHVHPKGLQHPVFTEKILKNYLVTGMYPGEQKGDPSMPVYTLSQEDLDAVVAYLKRLENDPDPGVTDTAIRVGTILPSEGRIGEMAQVMRKTIEGYFAGINANGGIYGRRLELVVRETGRKALPKDKLKSWLDRNELFILLSTLTPGMEREVASLAEEEHIPLVGPFTMFPLESTSLNRSVFYLFPGLREQTRALAGFAKNRFGGENLRPALVYPSSKDMVEIVDAAGEGFADRGFGAIRKNEYPSGNFSASAMVSRLKEDRIGLVLFLGNESESGAFLAEAERQWWTPHVLLSGVLLGKGIYSIPPVFAQKLHVAYPTLPADRKEWGMKELARAADMENLSVNHLPARQSAYAAAKILVEGLRRSGRDLKREKFLSALENLTDYDTGLTPPISYDRNRRIGVMGAYIVTADPGHPNGVGASPEWVEAY